jgi:glioma pathogenesis-related protein 2
MITVCVARVLQRCTSHLYVHFLLTFQEIMPISKTRNQLIGKHGGIDTEVDMGRPRAILIGTILSMIAFGTIDTRAADRLDLAAFREGALQQHNVYQIKHGVPPLVLSPQLNEVAQQHVAQLARTNQLVHSAQEHYGENLYASHASDSTPPRPEAVVDSWYNEIQHYDFNQPGFRPDTGHFTQVVWKASHELGMGIAQASDGTWYVVGNYRPPGNIANQFTTNVPKPTH